MIRSVANLLEPQCQDVSFLPVERDVFSIVPLTTVVRPWRGRHHVYSIFALPKGHYPSYPILLTVKGIGQFRKEFSMVRVLRPQDYPVPPGYYAVRTHLRTRFALFAILQGLYGRLRARQNWVLSYTLIKYQKMAPDSQTQACKGGY